MSKAGGRVLAGGERVIVGGTAGASPTWELALPIAE
jgi:hypothetical protein